ncbi:hypothetical protein BC833DRAFT_598946 [Globomyces pollinis-pini]|nr:hypothetical protein BC833DRAFT_598946 [Globomyces pollinis-pini]KAJ2995446.1 hypothetical protein HDV02_000780 [Globomyces sp. JEL0801]
MISQTATTTLNLDESLKSEWDGDALPSPNNLYEKQKLHGDQFYTDNQHGLILALHTAFRYHLDFSVSPDDVWTIINFGLGDHINANPEKYRALLGIKFEGKKDILIRRPGMHLQADLDSWLSVFDEFDQKIVKETTTGFASQLSLNFSTTSKVRSIVNTIGLMGSMKSFFKYRVNTRCGIPRIQIKGTVDDWNSIIQTVEKIPIEFQLEEWKSKLLPILRNFTSAIKNPQQESSNPFWQSIYKYRSGSGNYEISGWILDLFPNLVGNSSVSCWSSFKTGFTQVPFVFECDQGDIDLEFVAGFLNPTIVGQTVTPQVGWGIYQ